MWDAEQHHVIRALVSRQIDHSIKYHPYDFLSQIPDDDDCGQIAAALRSILLETNIVEQRQDQGSIVRRSVVIPFASLGGYWICRLSSYQENVNYRFTTDMW